MKERFERRDARLKEFAATWKPGVELEAELQQDFLTYCGQIASRKCFRMNVRGEKLEEIVSSVQFAFLLAIATGKYLITESPVAGYLSIATRNEIFFRAAKDKAKTNWVEKRVGEMKVSVKNRSLRPTEEEVVTSETLGEIFGAIGDLSPEQQAPILLLAQGASHQEICEELQISDSSLRGRLYRARAEIREALDRQNSV